jgi:DNA invertase Pin-like site-specific DNA recombinase
MVMRLIAYLRVSSNGQLDAYGPEVQLKDIRTWARHYGHRIVDTKTDDVPGGTPAQERPQLVEALRMLRKPPKADGLVVANLGRLARELTIQEAILAHVWTEGGMVFAADQGEILKDAPDDPMRTAMRQMQGVFAQLDRALVTKRLRAGRKIKADSGKHSVGQYAYGTHGVGKGRDRDAGPNEQEQAAVDRIKALRGEGASYRAIATTLDEEGLRPRRAEHWSAMTVRNIVARTPE